MMPAVLPTILTHDHPTDPSISSPSSETPSQSTPTTTQLLAQGAEAHIYRTTFLTATRHAILKHRPSKSYRHPVLDAKLTRHRVLAEARTLVKLRREGVYVPAVYSIDWEAGWILMEEIQGRAVKDVLRDLVAEQTSSEERERDLRTSLRYLMRSVGTTVGSIHAVGVIHGDLTTSNLMVRRPVGTDAAAADNLIEELHGNVVPIDFGLASQSMQDEDRAVDLYVLERAFGTTHSDARLSVDLEDGKTESGSSQGLGLFGAVLQAYAESYQGAKAVVKRLEEVRMRGRKKILLG